MKEPVAILLRPWQNSARRTQGLIKELKIAAAVSSEQPDSNQNLNGKINSLFSSSSYGSQVKTSASNPL